MNGPSLPNLASVCAGNIDSISGPDCGLVQLSAANRNVDEMVIKGGKEQRGWRRVIRNFTPSYVLVPHAFIRSVVHSFKSKYVFELCSATDPSFLDGSWL